MKHKKKEPRCIKCGSSLVWAGRKICQRCLMMGTFASPSKEEKGKMTKKLEIGQGWFDRTTGEEIEIVGWGMWTTKGRKTYTVGIQYMENKQIKMILSKSEFLSLFRRKGDEG